MMPLFLSFVDSPTDFVLNATAAFFICELDNIDSISLWFSYKDPTSKSSIYYNEEGFGYNVLHKEDDLGFEIRQYSVHNYVEYDSFPGMKVAMAGKKTLKGSHIITQAKVGNDKLCDIFSIKQPIEISNDLDNVKETKKMVVAVAKLSNPLYNYSIFNMHCSKQEMISHGHKELKDALTLSHFQLSTLMSEEEIVVFVKYNGTSSDDAEVWVYLDNDNEQVMKLLKVGDDDAKDNSESRSAGDSVVNSNSITLNEINKECGSMEPLSVITSHHMISSGSNSDNFVEVM